LAWPITPLRRPALVRAYSANQCQEPA